MHLGERAGPVGGVPVEVLLDPLGVAERRRHRVRRHLAGVEVEPVTRPEAGPPLAGQVLGQPVGGLLDIREQRGAVEPAQRRVEEARRAGERYCQLGSGGPHQPHDRPELTQPFGRFDSFPDVRWIVVTDGMP